jgi:hypothetical protein
MISAIPTDYNGIRYRSRTEARWAVFFDKAMLPFRYEAEGYQTDSGWYLPDFVLSGAERTTFFEVKPASVPTAREVALMSALSRGMSAHVFVAAGPPERGSVIWKVFSDGSHAQWHFGKDRSHRVCFLTDIHRKQTLPIRAAARPESLSSFGAGPELTAASQYKFTLFDEGSIRIGYDRRDWRQRERANMMKRTADHREWWSGRRERP